MLDDRDAFVRMQLLHLAVEHDRQAYLRGLIDLCTQALDAERCTIYFVDHQAKEIRSRIASRIALQIRLPFGTGIAGQAAASGETINVSDAYADPRFDRNTDRRSGYRTRNLLVVPVWGSDGRTVIGVIQVLNKRSGPFERGDQMLLERVAAGVGPALAAIAAAEPA